jgi:cytochrome d ubiquinol oxidase subunit II
VTLAISTVDLARLRFATTSLYHFLFPAWYATMFSGMYLALLLVLFLLIIRVVSFEWRTKSESPGWRSVWTWANTIGSFGAALIWGVGLSNLVHGLPIDSHGHYVGSFWDLFSPYTVFAGIAVVLLFAWHGATFLTLRTTGDLHGRARSAARRLSIPAALVAVAFLTWTVGVAMDRNDKDLFPPALPAAIGIAALGWPCSCCGEAAPGGPSRSPR